MRTFDGGYCITVSVSNILLQTPLRVAPARRPCVRPFQFQHTSTSNEAALLVETVWLSLFWPWNPPRAVRLCSQLVPNSRRLKYARRRRVLTVVG